MELYQNQVTRRQGPFSLRMFHRSFGLMMIQSNIDAPCVLLDFPSLDRFVEELENNSYDIVGIGAIIPNVGKVKKMCELVRCHCPGAVIVVGGHVANTPDLENIVDADHIVKGDGGRMVQAFSGPENRCSRATSGSIFRFRRQDTGAYASRQTRRHGGSTDSFRRVPHRVQFLFDLRAVRRQRQVRQFLRNGRRAFLRNARTGEENAGEVLFRARRKFPVPQKARVETAGTDAGKSKKLVAVCFQLRPGGEILHHGTIGRTWGGMGLDGNRRPRERLSEAIRRGHAKTGGKASVLRHSGIGFHDHRHGPSHP